MSAILQVQHLVKQYGGLTATDDLNLELLSGELHAIIGPNGAGKTTLVSQLSGFVAPTSGKIIYKGTDITYSPPHTRAHMGIARTYQITSLIMDMTVQENIALAIQARDGHSYHFFTPAKSVKRIQDGALAVLEKVGLADKAEMKTSELSHGEHRNMEVGVALAAHADLLLLDEPMAGLGPDETGKMIDLLNSLKGDHTILLIEHDMDAVFALADRISVLVYGNVIATGSPDEIRGNEKVQHAYLGEE